MGLQVEVSDSNSKSPALKRPIGSNAGNHKDSPVKSVWLVRYPMSIAQPREIMERIGQAKTSFAV